MKKKIVSIILSCLLVLQLFPINVSAESQYNLGCLLDSDAAIEARLLYQTVDESSLPSSFDNTSQYPSPGNQGTQGSCTSWAVAYAYKSHQERMDYGYKTWSDGTKFSPSFVYNQTVVGNDGGSYISSAFSLLVNSGDCTLRDMPYNQNDYKTKPNELQKQKASVHKAKQWFTTKGVSNIKKNIIDTGGVVIGIPVYPDFDKITWSNQVYDDVSGTSRGNHAICLIGYDDAKGAFKFINSWGGNWGLSGYGYIAYSLIEKLNTAGYVMIDSESPSVGDVNRDGVINIRDATLVQKYVSEIVTFSEQEIFLGDVNFDGVVDMQDAILIQKYILELITEF